MNRRSRYFALLLSWLAALPALIGVQPPPAAPSPPRLPNIVFILADDMGWSDLACYGSTFHETPNIDRLRAQGMKFTQAYAACTVCSPTRASIMTGRYPARLHLTNFLVGRRVPENSPVLPPDYRPWVELDEIMLPEALKPAGYVSGSFGKWHMGPIETHGPLPQGFDEGVEPPKHGAGDPKSTTAITNRALDFLERHRDQPFLLYVPYFAVHIPLEGRPEDIAHFAARLRPDDPHHNALYAAMIRHLDESVGRLLDKLDELKLSDRTMVVFTSDNGGLHVLEGPNTPATSNAPLRGGKGWLYEGGHRVPLIVRWPGTVTPNTVCPEPVSSIDYFPTLLEIARVPAPAGRTIDGVSFLPLLRGQRPTAREAFYWHYPHFSNQGGMPGGAVRQGDWKLIEFYHDRHWELYNLHDDPGETCDLASRMPERAARLRAMLDRWRQSVDAQPMRPNPDYNPNQPTDYTRGHQLPAK